MGSTDEHKGWLRRLFGRTQASALDPTRPDLVVVVASYDDAEACSSALDTAASESPRWQPEEESVLRHHLLLPRDRIDDAVAVASQDGYAAAPDTGEQEPSGEDTVPLTLQRVQLLDALHCSQERSRMAGLAQRLDGTVTGWDALQPVRDDAASTAG
ncbi:MAG: hypothetical protein GX610_05585 [Rhodococcus sp.]|mgnify:CR=1 FL=1|nr:hypothetical protein [Rhodococcus sp. (in: high G+C Gram-positive bacteria)]